MQKVNYQTVNLSRGRHTSPAYGACVMELASMLAGEPFTDHPSSVSRPIAAFLRTYNDLVDDKRRQDLYAFAAKCVGTAASESAELLRGRRLAAWGNQMRRRNFWTRVFGWLPGRGGASHLTDPEDAARYAARSVGRPTDQTHAAALALVDELIAVGSESRSRHVDRAQPEDRSRSEEVEVGEIA